MFSSAQYQRGIDTYYPRTSSITAWNVELSYYPRRFWSFSSFTRYIYYSTVWHMSKIDSNLLHTCTSRSQHMYVISTRQRRIQGPCLYFKCTVVHTTFKQLAIIFNTNLCIIYNFLSYLKILNISSRGCSVIYYLAMLLNGLHRCTPVQEVARSNLAKSLELRTSEYVPMQDIKS